MPRFEEMKFMLASGSQVREEEFGLLFYTMKGPRLYFLNCGRLLTPSFFQGRLSLREWCEMEGIEASALSKRLKEGLESLSTKGVINGL